MSGKYLAGIGIALCTTFMSAMGLALQKRAHIEIEQRRLAAAKAGRPTKHEKQFQPTRHPLWLLGLVLMASSALLSLAVFALVGQSVASAFAAVTIVYNIFLATFFLHERFRMFDLGIAIVMIIGTVLTVVFGSRGANSGFLSLDDILNTFSRPAAIAGFTVFGCLIVINMAYLWMVDKKHAEGQVSKRGFQFRVTLFLRCLTAGLFSGFVGTFSKTVVTVFAAAVNQGASENLGRWETWIFVILLPTSLVFQVIYLNSALKRFDATEAVPLYQSLVVTCGVLFGWTIFNEAAGKSIGDIVGFLCGVIIIIIGILSLLVKKRPPPPVVNVIDTVKTLMDRPILQVNTLLRRAHSAPGNLSDLAPRLPQRPCTQFSRLDAWVPVFRPAGTEVQSMYLIEKDTAKPLSPSSLLRAPVIEESEQVAGHPVGDRRRLAPQLFVNVLVPACAGIQTERAHNHLYEQTRSVAAVADMVVDVAPEDEEAMREETFDPFRLRRLPLLLGNPDVGEPEEDEARRQIKKLTHLHASLRQIALQPGHSMQELTALSPRSRAVTASAVTSPRKQQDVTGVPAGAAAPAPGHRLEKSISLPAVLSPGREAGREMQVDALTRMHSAKAKVPETSTYAVSLPVRKPQVMQRFASADAARAGTLAEAEREEEEGDEEDYRSTTSRTPTLPPTIMIPLTVAQTIPFDPVLLSAMVRARDLQTGTPRPESKLQPLPLATSPRTHTEVRSPMASAAFTQQASAAAPLNVERRGAMTPIGLPAMIDETTRSQLLATAAVAFRPPGAGLAISPQHATATAARIPSTSPSRAVPVAMRAETAESGFLTPPAASPASPSLRAGRRAFSP